MPFQIFELTSGDDYVGGRRLRITVLDSDQQRVDITGADLTFMVKQNKGDADVDALITKVTPTEIEIVLPQTGDDKGIALLQLDAADTEDLSWRYYWELQAADAFGVITLARGTVYIKGDLVEAAS
jgi:hypothetical protein